MASAPIHFSRRLSASLLSSAKLRRAPRVLNQLSCGGNNGFSSDEKFAQRHIGPTDSEASKMLAQLGYQTISDFLDNVVPRHIRTSPDELNRGHIPALTEADLLRHANTLSSENQRCRSYIGLGYHNVVVPSVILRNVAENPAWYTPYTPYQPEVAQGRLESLINFQTMVMSLTSMHVANASLLDEGTAAAEGMALAYFGSRQKKNIFFVDRGVLPQTIAVLQTRGKGFGIEIVIGDIHSELTEESLKSNICGVLVQYPSVDGDIADYSNLAKRVHDAGSLVICATDLLALTLLKPPGEWGADVVVGNSARFGIPMGYGGPHAAFFACTEKLKRKMPGRLVGRTKDAYGNEAYRLALQTREQHIRRERATSNICTSQALLANMAAMYAVYHGPAGLKAIASRVHHFTQSLRHQLVALGFRVLTEAFFDTLKIKMPANVPSSLVHRAAGDSGINLRHIDDGHVGVALDETVNEQDVLDIVKAFATASGTIQASSEFTLSASDSAIPSTLHRQTPFLPHPVFNTHHSETQMMRYIYHLQSKDLSLIHSMIPLGSCTMKLNSATSMMLLTTPGFSDVHPFAPINQVKGYRTVLNELESQLCTLTGFKACSLQPNSGASGEYAGLSVIRAYHAATGQHARNICLVPVSAHGTNPASAVMAGLKVVPVNTLPSGTLDLRDLEEKAERFSDNLAALMITYPSTYGVFEEGVTDACAIVHKHGGQVYFDGANLNAMIGLSNPSICGGDVCHINLHKTFAIPHGGGGPGAGPICVAEHLAPYLPAHPLVETGGADGINAVSSAPFGSASVLLISWAYVKMLGTAGLSKATATALLNANYIASRLKPHYSLKYMRQGCVAHELLIDLGEFDKAAGLKVMDFAKRLQDYGFHPPTCSWPSSTAMLIEPTESESLEELDRFCDAMITIRREVDDIVKGEQPRDSNLLKNAPHPMSSLLVSEHEWQRPYTREQAAFPLPHLRQQKFWPSVGRVDDAYGDLNLVCDCPSVVELASDQ